MPNSVSRPCSLRAVGERGLDRDGAAVGEKETTSGTKFVSLGVSAEVVVIVENQDARFRASVLAMEIRGGEPADASANDD